MQRLNALQRFALLRPKGTYSSTLHGNEGVVSCLIDSVVSDDSYVRGSRYFAAQPDAVSAEKEDLIEVTVNGRVVSVPKGSNVLQACEAGGVDVPRYALFCEWGERMTRTNIIFILGSSRRCPGR
jgi:hypothetical protein